MTSLRLSQKYGLNPTLSQCFWCGGDKNEIALLGANGGKEAAKHTVLNYEPCDTCKDRMALGVTIIEASKHSDRVPPIQEGCYPTGRWWVVKREAIPRIFGEFGAGIKDTVLIEVGVAESIGLSGAVDDPN